MLGAAPIDTLPDRVDALRSALQTAMPSRVHKSGYRRDLDDHEIEELEAGVVQLIALSENDYADSPGKIATEGTLSVAVVLQLKVDEHDDGTQVEDAELAAAEQFKSFVRAGVAGLGLTLVEIRTSEQQATPYGFVVAQINAGPPRDNLT